MNSPAWSAQLYPDCNERAITPLCNLVLTYIGGSGSFISHIIYLFPTSYIELPYRVHKLFFTKKFDQFIKKINGPENFGLHTYLVSDKWCPLSETIQMVSGSDISRILTNP